jgi:hypothetical protein
MGGKKGKKMTPRWFVFIWLGVLAVALLFWMPGAGYACPA